MKTVASSKTITYGKLHFFFSLCVWKYTAQLCFPDYFYNIKMEHSNAFGTNIEIPAHKSMLK